MPIAMGREERWISESFPFVLKLIMVVAAINPPSSGVYPGPASGVIISFPCSILSF
jgi:hypothetical protein